MTRPKTLKSKSHILSVRLPHAEFLRLRQFARDQARPISNCGRYFISKGLASVAAETPTRRDDDAA